MSRNHGSAKKKARESARRLKRQGEDREARERRQQRQHDRARDMRE
jgi:hypothetical protein